jgi:polar amino acid transport system substrate-binding protein
MLLTILCMLVACDSANSGHHATTPTKTALSSTPTTQLTPQQASISAPKDLLTSGTLIVGTHLTAPPLEYTDTTTRQSAGFDIDLVTAIAQKMGLQVRIVPDSFDSLLPNLQASRYDVVISGVTINDARKQNVDFVPYLSAGASLLVSKGNPQNVQSLSDLCGKMVGVQLGTAAQSDAQFASQACQQSKKPAIHLIVQQDQSTILQLLSTRHVVALYQSSPVNDYEVNQYPGHFAVVSSAVPTSMLGIAVRKNDSAMIQPVQNAFNALQKNGTYHALIMKWGMTSGDLTTGQ